MSDTQTQTQAEAQAVLQLLETAVATAPVAVAAAAKGLSETQYNSIVQQWYGDYLCNSPVSRSSEALSTVQQALPKLVALLVKG